MSTHHHGIPASSAPLAAVDLRAPELGERVTVIPALPLVPVRALLARALREDTIDRDIAWVDLAASPNDASAWIAIRDSVAKAVGTTARAAGGPKDGADAIRALVSKLSRPLLLAVLFDPAISHDVDSGLLGLLSDVPLLSLVAVSPARRLVEVLGRVEHESRLISGSALVVDADGIQTFAAKLGVQLTHEDALALAQSPLSLPDVLPAVIASASLEEMETQGDAVTYLLDETESYLSMHFRASSHDDVTGLLPLAVPSKLTTEILGIVAPAVAARTQLDRAAQARIVLRESGPGEPRYRMEPMLRRILITELRFRDPELSKRLSSSLAEHFRDNGDVFEAIAHYSDAEDWAAVVDILDSAMFRLLEEDPLRVHDAILTLPRWVRDENPRFTLCLEVGWQPREGLAQAYLAIARRAAGIFGRLPKETSAWDRLHVLLIKTIVFRLKGDFSVALEAAAELDALLDSDDDIAARPLGTLAEAHYQSGMTRLLGLDIVGARESFSRSYSLLQNHSASSVRLLDRAAEATALVRALEGETDHAETWLSEINGHALGTAGHAAQVLIAIGRLDAEAAQEGLARLADLRDHDELWVFATHAANRYGLYWGDPVETDATLDRAWAEHGEQLVAGSTAQVLLTSDAADLALMLGQLSRAEAALDQVSVRNTWIAVPRARLALLAGNAKHALLFILEGQRRGRTERSGQLDLAVLRAAAELALGREDDATASLLRAVNQAEKSGVIVPFHVLPHDTVTRLASLHPEAERFLARHEIHGTTYLAPYTVVAGALSERELIVLRSLEPGATVEQIAKKLFVANNTVKAQLRSIYRKLNVSTRTEALLVAAELGLLDEDSRTA
ncbi:MAG TPA: LuxR C-terminal-related transcriptional regulator [Pseudolysinimonas sp.]|nr:LuxR C-terminal-related transcriptional regulator [Pseudolysinimonas sp.]